MAKLFFDLRSEQSAIKTEIVVNYFMAWSRIMARRSERIGYFDFYAGPGRYENGEKSTPLLVLEAAIRSDHLPTRLVSVFNDEDKNYAAKLGDEIRMLDKIETLSYEPQVLCGPVRDELIRRYEDIRTIPALSFFDPWGYKGLSIRFIRAVIKDWGSEAVFFFNYNRINMGLTNPLVRTHMIALFGEERLRSLHEGIHPLSPAEREEYIMGALHESMKDIGARYLQTFTFRRSSGRVGHYVCFVSKDPRGYAIMKDVMAGRSKEDEDGVPLYEYSPLPEGEYQLPLGLSRPLLDLPDELRRDFAGKTLSFEQLYEQHHIGRPFVRKNYRKVLLEMEAKSEIVCEPSKRRAGTMAKRVRITFPQERA